jgi:MFS family permease
MYQVESAAGVLKAPARLRRARVHVGRTVVLLGVTSLLTDVSAEMVATVLPLYLLYTVGASPLALGLVTGLYEGSAALVRLAAGHLGDRTRRHKEVATVGYALSAVSKLGLVLAAAAPAVGALVLVDRTGKGIRTAPRDALISLSAPRERLGAAFGVHRALDTAGAMLGPFIAFGLLAIAPLAFDAVFAVSFCFALVGLAVITLFVRNEPATTAEPETPASLRGSAALLKDRRFRGIVGAGGLLSVATVGDALLYVVLQRKLDLELTFFPLLFVGTALVFMLFSVPLGELADRVGRGKVFALGYTLLLGVYGLLLAGPGGPLGLVLPLVALGLYYAATDGVLPAMASSTVPEELRGTGLAVLATATNLGRIVASVSFGAIWAAAGMNMALAAAAVALGIAAVIAIVGVRRG